MSPDLELLHLKCRPHYLPREINVIHLFAVYIPPSANTQLAVENVEQFVESCIISNPDSAIIIVGDFNKARLPNTLHQYVTFNTRENSQLDLCYSNIKDAYKAYQLPPLGASDHKAIQLVPTYQTNYKKMKKGKVTKRILDDEAIEKCMSAFETTDWSILKSDDLDEHIQNVTDYINFVTTTNATEKQFYTKNNQRPWITSDIKSLMSKKAAAHRSNNPAQEKIIQKEIDRHIAEAKLAYKNKMLGNMSSNIKNAWQGIKTMSGLSKTKSDNYDLLSPSEQYQLANELNTFYNRFTPDDDADQSSSPSEQPGSSRCDDQPSSSEPSRPVTDEAMPPEISVEEVRKQLRMCKTDKASGPDELSAKILKSCYFSLAPIFCDIFNRCLLSGRLPKLWKLSNIIPVPKKANPKENNDFRPIALTSILMKCFEHIMKDRLLTFISLDENQFAYKQKRSTKDACLSLDYFLRSHLETSFSYARVLFVDFSSAFNTIVPNILLNRLQAFNVPRYLINFVSSFLIDRKQYVTVGKQKSDTFNCSVGCPQGCVLSPVLFSIYTDFIQSVHPNVKILKYADDMAIIGLLNFKEQNDAVFYFDAIERFVDQCHTVHVNLSINASKTK